MRWPCAARMGGAPPVPRFLFADARRTAVLLGVQNADGEWVAIAAGTPVSPPRYLAKSTRMDWEFLALSGPQKRGEWEIDLPPNAFGEQRSGVLRAWALDFRRHVLYQLPGDQEFAVISEPTAQEKSAQPALIFTR